MIVISWQHLTSSVLHVLSLIALTRSQAWQRGRATYYGSPIEYSKAYDPSRGQGSFGMLAYGSCGYTEMPGATVPFAMGAVGASADQNPDYPGSCGRCYEVRCVSGIVEESAGNPVKIWNGYFGGDKWRPDLAAINPGMVDSRSRKWPGNSAAGRNESYVQCWSDAPTLRIIIIDSCPCTQVLPWGEVRIQEWCCGKGEPHFDLSYWAFEQLAHPVFGVQMIDFRPVDCYSGSPLQYLPGFVSPNIYRDGIGAGWSWYPYSVHQSQLKLSGYGPDGLPATCVDVAKGGGLQFRCRECSRQGYQPFSGVRSISFWIRSNSDSYDWTQTASPKGQVPLLKMFLLNAENQHYCSSEPYLNSGVKPSQQKGDWYLMQLSIGAFGCSNPWELDQLEFQNTGIVDARFCIADLKLEH